jgi:DNA-directed RNA polymerase subunit RPC12/RpoP
MAGYRCSQCGNKTRFDVLESKRVRSYHHFTLAGELSIEEEEVLDHEIESVTCRWCGSTDVEEVASGSVDEASTS